MIIKSAWRGLARNASIPNRARSNLDPAVDIISMAQHANPKVKGHNEFALAWFSTVSNVVTITFPPFSISPKMGVELSCRTTVSTRFGMAACAPSIPASPQAPSRVRNDLPAALSNYRMTLPICVERAMAIAAW
jgi:hypothetical protein